jgi:hypothetical protein
MDDLAPVEVVGTESEAELLCSLLRSAGIRCMHQPTNMGAAVFEGLPGGPRQVLVRIDDLAAARQVLEKSD